LRKLSHQRRKIEEELAWFDKYLFKTAEEKNEALKPGSPLAIALKLKNIKRSGSLYGAVVAGKLVPETLIIKILKSGVLKLPARNTLNSIQIINSRPEWKTIRRITSALNKRKNTSPGSVV